MRHSGNEPVASESEALDRLQRGLAGRYVVGRELGRGGAAVVFLARDLKHGREVALKLLRPEVSALLGGERFLREIQVAATLQHPHILPLYDSGEAEGVLYYVMPYVAGESLRRRLERERQLPIGDVVALTGQVASALDYAHRRGVIHRDIKPENILLHEGEPLLADFGIALAVGSAGVDRLTGTGISLGTPQYMSPEQAAGDRVAGPQSDVYSLAVVAYEMLVGEPPITGSSSHAVIARLLVDPPRPIRSVRATVPAGIESAILKALAKTPADRYATARQLAEAIERGASAGGGPAPHATAARQLGRRQRLAAAGVLVAAAIGAAGWGVRGRVGASPDRIESIAVLPLENLSRDPEQQHVVDGLHAALVGELGQVGGLRVVSRTSTMRYRGSGKALPEIARELGVDGVVEGSAVRDADTVRLHVRLMQAAPERQLWARAFDAELRHVEVLQRDVVRSIVEQLQIRLTPDERARLASARAVDPAAHEAYLRGMYHAESFTPEGLAKAVALLEEATRIDSDYPLPYVGLARIYSYHASGHGTAIGRREAYTRGKAAALKAIQLDETLADAHAELGLIHLHHDWDWEGARRELTRAIALEPNSARAHWGYAIYLEAAGRFDEALSEIRRAQQLDPLSKIIAGDVAVRYYFTARYDEAITWARKSLELEPDFPPSLFILGAAYREKRMFEQAIAAHEQAAARTPTFLVDLACTYAAAGQPRRARATLAAMGEDLRRRNAIYVAAVHAALGERGRALQWLDLAYREHDPYMHSIWYEPSLKSLRSEPRFEELVRRLGLPK
jgi:serine/threonine-protein kinase